MWELAQEVGGELLLFRIYIYIYIYIFPPRCLSVHDKVYLIWDDGNLLTQTSSLIEN